MILAPPKRYFRRTDILPDGQRFLVAEKTEPSISLSQINIVTNWFEELKARVPTGKQ